MADLVTQQLQEATQHMQAGRIAQAEGILQQVVLQSPDRADAQHLLGVIAYITGRHEQAVQFMSRSTRLDPKNVSYLSDLGDACRTSNLFPEAIEACRRALAIQPTHVEALNNLGATHIDAAQPAEAIAPLLQAANLAPGHLAAHYNLGRAYLESGDAKSAIAPLQRALQINPRFIQTYLRLLDALTRAEQYAEADRFCGALVLAAPSPAEGWAMVGNVLRSSRRMLPAITAFQNAMALAPKDANLPAVIGICLHGADRVCDAEDSYRKSLAIDPNNATALNGIGNVCLALGRPEEAIEAYRKVLKIVPDAALAHSNLLLLSQYQPGITSQKLAELHREYAVKFTQPLRSTWRDFSNTPDPDRRLRLGFTSADFQFGPVASLTVGVLGQLDPAQFECYLYSDTPVPDVQTARFRKVGHWRTCNTLDHNRLAESIRADKIDILFDLSGHINGNRMLTFSRKPAPIQITWLGYEGTTGVDAIDYIVADEIMIPPEEEISFVEKPLRMPGGYVSYEPHPQAPPIGSVPSESRGFVTFGSFSNPAKFNLPLYATWAKILNQFPRSQLFLKYRSLDDPRSQDFFRKSFTSAGGRPEQLRFAGWTPIEHSLKCFDEVDISLDTFPFNGSATTCDSLWQGVPVVSLYGKTFAGRHGAGHLSRVGLGDLVARSEDQYVDVAVKLARDPQRLKALRASLRATVSEKLCDGKRLADEIGHSLRSAWRKWCDSRQAR